MGERGDQALNDDRQQFGEQNYDRVVPNTVAYPREFIVASQ